MKTLRTENVDLKKCKRYYAVQRKCFEDAGRKTNKIGMEHERTKKELAAATSALGEAHARLVEAEKEIERLSGTKEMGGQELDSLRRKVWIVL